MKVGYVFFAVSVTLGVCLAACGSQDAVQVALNLSVDDDGSCQLAANVANQTKYHLSGATINLGDYRVQIPEMSANAKSDNVVLGSIDPNDEFVNCEAVAKEMDKRARSASVIDCSMQGLAEGDCQSRIKVTADFDVKSIRAQDAKYVERVNAKAAKIANYLVKKGGFLKIFPANENGQPRDSKNSQTTSYLIPGSNDTGREYGHGTQFNAVFDGRQGIIKVKNIHKNARGIVDWYLVSALGERTPPPDPMHAADLFDLSGLVPADDLAKLLGDNIEQAIADAAQAAPKTEAAGKALTAAATAQAAEIAAATAKCAAASKTVAVMSNGPPSEDDIKNAFQRYLCAYFGGLTTQTVESIANVNCTSAEPPDFVKDQIAGKPVFRCDFASSISNTKDNQRRAGSSSEFFVRADESWHFIWNNRVWP